ncbi:MAG TPA: YidC/Oxa1 family membrane protein insertase [Candidatus Paceibacterota bacterium]
MFDTIFYRPLYNTLVWLIDISPNHDAGIAVVALTLIVSVLLYSISKKAIKTQLALKEIEPELKQIKEEVKSKEEQARQTMALYKKYKVNPFSMILLIIIQFPILIALYYVFFKGLPIIHTDALYSFVKAPESVDMVFLGIVDLSQKNIILAVIAGITQFIQAAIVSSYTKKQITPEGHKKTMQEEFANSMQMQMKYFLPVVIGVIGATLPSALPLYWSVRNIFTSFQELIVRRKGLKN